MENKSLKILSLSILFLIVIMSSISALSITSSSTTLSQEGGSFILTVSGATENESISFSVTDSEGILAETNIIDDLELDGTSGTTESINYVVDSNFDFEFGKEYSIEITATEEGDLTNNNTIALTFAPTPFYEGENQGDLEISNIEFDILEGFGDDEDYWYPFDEVEITFNIENVGDWDDIKDIKIEACLWDELKGKCIFDEDDMEIDEDEFDLDSGDDLDVTITLKIDADKLTEGNRDYTFYVRAIGEIKDKDYEEDEKETGISDFKEIDIITDDNFVIIEDIKFQPDTVSCGGIVELTAKAWNVGDEDLEDDEVYVRIYNKELGIDELVEFDSGIGSMDYEKISLSFEVPEDIEEKTYMIKLTVYDDDSLGDDDIFKTDEEDSESSYQGFLKVEGSCSVIPSVSVSANLESEAKAGEDLVVKATLKNTGDKSTTYTLTVESGSWAVLDSINPTSITLDAEESKDVLITLNVNKDVSGDKVFGIEVISEGETILNQPVPVTVQEQTGFNFLGITGNMISEGNWYLWGIGALNVLLIVVIIIVALKVAKKSE